MRQNRWPFLVTIPVPGRGEARVARGDQTRSDVVQRDDDQRATECGQALVGGIVSGEVGEAPLYELVQQGCR